MAAEPSNTPHKKIPKTESAPILIGSALIVAALLAIAFSVLFADSDATLRRKVLGKWQVCPKDQACVEFIFTADGEVAMRQMYIDLQMDLRSTWSIHNKEITLELKGGGDWLSSTGAGLLKLFGYQSAKARRWPIRFEGNSVMYLGNDKFVRLGNTSQ